ncbi:MAG TPA: toll/interleukin-1 receptor domain-containing protein [Polyangiaceae bacterium]
MGKLFISHAVHDKALVESVVDLLESGVGVPHRSIFCSSLKGLSIKPGKDFVDSIRENLDEATCVVALISEAYYASAFCMCELGGVWLQSKSFLPVLVPPLDFSGLKAVLSGLQVSKIASEEDLDELRDELVERLDIEGHATPRWNSKRKAFLDELPAKVKAIRFKGPVPRPAFEKLEKEFNAYREEYGAREREIDQLKMLFGDLKKAKDPKSVAKIVQKHSSSAQVFESLIGAAAAALKPLPEPVCEALYYRERRDEYFPEGREAWADVRTQLEYGLLELNSNENGVSPRAANPKVKRAVTALDELFKWLEEPPEDFHEWYEEEADGDTPDITLRAFWDRHLV